MVIEQAQTVHIIQGTANPASLELFRNTWKHEFAPCMDIPEPEMFPPEYLSVVPVPNREAVVRFPAGSHIAFGRLGHQTFTNSRGFEIKYPVAEMEDGQEMPITHGEDLADFNNRFMATGDRILTKEDAAYRRRCYEVTAMITGGLDSGLKLARQLQALSVYEHTSGRNNTTLRETFYGDGNMEIVRENSEHVLDVAAHCLSESRVEKFFHTEGVLPQDEFRRLVTEAPEYVLQYLVDQITGLSLHRDLYRQVDFIEKFYDGISQAVSQANVGQSSERNDFVYTHINDAISLLRDIIEVEKHPYAFAVANKAIFDRTGMDYTMRFNSEFLTQQFYEMMIGDRIVSPQDVLSGNVVVRANIKPARALLYEVFKDEEIRRRIQNEAQLFGLSFPSGDSSRNGLLEVNDAVELFNNMLAASIAGEKMSASKGDATGLLDFVFEKMRIQYDIVRARVYFNSKESLNRAAARVGDIISNLPHEVRQTLDKRAEIYIRDWIWTMDEYKDVKVRKEPYDGVQFGYGDDLGGYLAERIMQAAEGSTLYEAGHAHVPVNIRLGQKLKTSEPNSVELQMMYGFQREMNDALDRSYKAKIQTLRGAGFNLEQINAILHRAKARARLILEKEKKIVKERASEASPYKGILLDFDGLMFVTSPLYEKAMSETFSECGLDPSLLGQVFKFDRSMGISCRSMVERIMSGKGVKGILDETIVVDLKAKLLTTERLVLWGKQVGINFDGDLGEIDVVSEIIAQYFERKGVEIIDRDPQEAKKLVRIVPGFLQFLDEISRKGVSIGIASGARRTTIERVKKLYGLKITIYAEEDVLSHKDKTTIAYKPELTFYSRAAGALSAASGLSEPLKDEEILIVGDNQSSEYHRELAYMAQAFNVLLVAQDDKRLQTFGERNVAKARYFADIWSMLLRGKIDDEYTWGDRVVLKRLLATCK